MMGAQVHITGNAALVMAQLVLSCLVVCNGGAEKFISSCCFLAYGLVVVVVVGHVVVVTPLAAAFAAYLAIGEDCSDSDVFEDAEWLLWVW